MWKCTALFILMSFISINAQTWNNLTYSEDQSGLEENPLKGFADLYGPQNDFPRSINGRLFGLNEVMTNLDEFNWSIIDNFIAQNKREGNFSYLQVNIDPGPDGNNKPRSYMPAFLDGQYDFIIVDGPVADICPDWNDPEILEAMVNFIDAFGAKYDTLPEVFMISLGLYGIYGEWQIGDAADIEPDFEMTQDNRVMIANRFKKAFPNTNLLARYAEHMPDPEVFGYSDGLFFSQSISTNTFFNHFYFGNLLDAYNAGQNWRNQVIGGEIDPCIQPLLWQNWPNVNTINCDPNNPSGQSVDVQDVVQTIEALHPTFLFSHHIFTDINPNPTSDEWTNAIRAQKKMGYTFFVEKYRLSASNGFPVIEANIQNTGVAPMYANWDIEFAVIDGSNNEFQSLGFQKWNLNIIQPDAVNNYRSFVSPKALEDGDYTFLFRVVNPLEAFSSSAAPVRFANDTQDANDMKGWLTLGQQTISSGSAGVSPISVSDMSISQSTATLTVGDNLQLTTIISPEDATEQGITWVSDEPGTASVSADGLVTTGPAYGTATITAYAQDGNFKGVCEINVDPLSVDIPALIEAEEFVRMNGIVSGFGKLGFIDDRDWIDYNVTVSSQSNFLIDIHASCPNCNDNLNQEQSIGLIEIKDEVGNVLDAIRLPKTNSFDDFKIATSKSLTLAEGTYNIRIEAAKGAFDIDKIEFKQDQTVGIESFEEESRLVFLYPNPTDGSVSITLGDDYYSSRIEAEIVNIYGVKIQSSIITDQTIDLSRLTSGVYFIILDIDGERAIRKIIKS